MFHNTESEEELREQVQGLEQEILQVLRENSDLKRRLRQNRISSLPTRDQLQEDLDDILYSWTHPHQTFQAVMLIRLGQEIDELKNSIDTAAYEWVIYQIGHRLQELIPEGMYLYHVRSLDFLVMYQPESSHSLRTFLALVLERVTSPVLMGSSLQIVRASLGMSLFPRDGRTMTELLLKANLALGQAQKNAKPFKIYSPEILVKEKNRQALYQDLLKALVGSPEEGGSSQFELYYQPKIKLSNLSESKARLAKIDAEVLIRWNHPQKGLLFPGTFLPLAEETGLILPLGKWLFYEFARFQERNKGNPLENSLAYSINVSPKQLTSSDLAEVLQNLVAQSALSAAKTTLELTESCLYEEPERTRQLLDKLKTMGFPLSLDDFGTGYSSLTNIHQFPISELKIDQSFVRNLPGNSQDLAIVQSTLMMGKAMGLSVIAEGVETQAQLQTLWGMGCDRIQGYLISHPLTESELKSFVERIHFQGMLFEVRNNEA